MAGAGAAVIIACDPGSLHGAIVVYDPIVDQVVDYCAWWRAGAGARYWLADSIGRGRAHSITECIYRLTVAHSPDVACVEGLFMDRTRPHGIMQLAEAAGEVIGVLRGRDPLVEIKRPKANEWRKLIGAASMSAASAEAHAERMATRWGLLTDDMRDNLDDVRSRARTRAMIGATSEAIIMARWAAGA